MVVTAVFVLAVSTAAAAQLPTIGAEVRPSVIANGDGSAITGGLDGTGRDGNLGHIQWITWSTTEAVGLGVEWDRCINYRSCPHAYTLSSKHPYRITATRPVNVIFTRTLVGGSCWLWRGRDVGYQPVSCRTWHP
jgi:hypothetical protein